MYFLHQDLPITAASLVLLAAFFDFLDGMVARILGVSGELGKQLDSLADMVSFGLVPAFFALYLLDVLDGIPGSAPAALRAMAPLLMAAMAAYRLAMFNIDSRQSDRFIGVPTPAVALFWLSLLLIREGEPGSTALQQVYDAFLASHNALAVAALICALLMVSPMPLISLKFKSFSWSDNVYRYLLIAAILVLLAFFAVKAVPIVLLLYLLLSILENSLSKRHEIQS